MGIIGAEPAKIHEINEHFLDYLNYGGYPEIALNADIQRDPARFIKSDIVDKVLLRDLPSLYGIANTQELNALFTALAYNTGEEVSLEKLSGQSGVTKNTIKRYIEYLEAAFLVKTRNKVDVNAKRFKRATSFKIYLTNPSIRAALFAPLSASDEKELGNVVETAVFSQWFHSQNDGLHLHYARWPKGEMDIVGLHADMSVQWAVEIKWSDMYQDKPEKLQAQIDFCKKQGLAEMTVTSKTIFTEKRLDGVLVEYKPTALYCYTLGHNILQDKWRY